MPSEADNASNALAVNESQYGRSPSSPSRSGSDRTPSVFGTREGDETVVIEKGCNLGPTDGVRFNNRKGDTAIGKAGCTGDPFLVAVQPILRDKSPCIDHSAISKTLQYQITVNEEWLVVYGCKVGDLAYRQHVCSRLEERTEVFG